MAQFKVSAKANSDLRDIGLYTQNKFGIQQRNKYLDSIVDKFHKLVNKPELGLKRNQLRVGYYSSLIQKHIIFYKKYKYGIRIIRVLHQNMDFDKHL